jgi:uncharacterized glyoxalase superfamily protein PhnB
MPPGDVIPELAYPDVTVAADWLSRAFAFSVRLRIANHRVQMSVGAGGVVLVTGEGDARNSPSHGVMVRVADVDAHFTQAKAFGARVSGPPATYPYGERQYAAEDLAGHRWVFSQSVADVDPAQWGGVLEVPP